jgi:hypothetical protein
MKRDHMKMLAGYLEEAISFQQMAAEETDLKLKVEFENRPPPIGTLSPHERKNTSVNVSPQRITTTDVTVRLSCLLALSVEDEH